MAGLIIPLAEDGKGSQAAAPTSANVVIPPDPPPGGWWDSVLRAANLPGQAQMVSDVTHGLLGVGASLYDVAALPQNLLADLSGLDVLRTKPGKERIKQGLEAAGLPGDVGPNWWDKSAEFVAGVPSMVLGGGVLAGAPGAVTRGVGEALAARPLQQAVAATGAGVGATLAHNQAPGPLSEFGGALLGGLAGGGLAGLVGGSVNALRGKLSLLGDPAEIAKRLYFGQTQDPDSALNRIIHYTRDPGPSGFKTTAEVTGDPGQATIEQSIRAGSGTGPAGFIARDSARQAERIALGDQIMPPEAGSAADVAARLRQQAELAAANAGTRMTEAEQGVARATQAIGPPLGPQQAGAQIQPGVAALEQASSREVGALKDAVDPDGVSAFRTKPIKDAVNAAADENLIGDVERRPQVVKDVLAALAKPNATFDELQKLRSFLLRESAPAPGQSPTALQVVQSRAASAIAKQIEDQAASGQGFTADGLDRWNAFRAAARTHGERFDSDPISNVTDTTRVPGRFRMGEVLAPGEFFQPGEAGGDTMKRFMTAITDPATGAPDPKMLESMTGYVAGKLGELTAPGQSAPSPAALMKFLSDHKLALDQLPPDVRRQFATLGDASLALERTGAATADSVQAANSGVARQFLNGTDPDRAMAQIITSKRGAADVAELQARMPPEGQEALKRSYINAMVDAMPEGAPGTAGLMKQAAWLDRTKSVRDQLFPPDQQRNFDLLRKDLQSQQDVLTSAEGRATSDLSNISNAQVLKALVDGAPVPRWAKEIANTLGQPTLGQMGWLQWVLKGTTRDVQAHLFDMARDPQVLAMLLRRASPEDLMRLAGRGQDHGMFRTVGRGAVGGIGLAAPTALRTGVLATSDNQP